MLTSLSQGLVGLLDRRLVLTAWAPVLLFWSGLGALAAAGPGWTQVLAWWTARPTEAKVLLGVLALAWITFTAYLLAAHTSLAVRIGEGYWPQRWPWSAARRRGVKRLNHRRDRFGVGHPSFARDFPLDPERTMPTRLGNILRAAEDHAHERYAINAIVVWPRLYVVLPDRFVATFAASRSGLDLMAAIGLLAAIFATAGTITALITTSVPIAGLCLAGGVAVTWLAYEGAVRSARPYAQLVRAAFDVHRTLLLDAMKLELPTTYGEERRQWEQISKLWYQGAPDAPRLLGYRAATTNPDGTGQSA